MFDCQSRNSSAIFTNSNNNNNNNNNNKLCNKNIEQRDTANADFANSLMRQYLLSPWSRVLPEKLKRPELDETIEHTISACRI
jgi:hypothetical protein